MPCSTELCCGAENIHSWCPRPHRAFIAPCVRSCQLFLACGMPWYPYTWMMQVLFWAPKLIGLESLWKPPCISTLRRFTTKAPPTWDAIEVKKGKWNRYCGRVSKWGVAQGQIKTRPPLEERVSFIWVRCSSAARRKIGELRFSSVPQTPYIAWCSSRLPPGDSPVTLSAAHGTVRIGRDFCGCVRNKRPLHLRTT